MNRTNRLRRSFLLVGVVALLAALLVVITACGEAENQSSSVGAAGDRPADWPSFTMEYFITNESDGSSPQVWELVYVDAWNWTKTLLENPADPSLEGTTEQFQDKTLTITQAGMIDPETGMPSSFTVEYPDAPVAPEPWLLRDRDLVYLERGYFVAENTEERQMTFVMEGTVPCEGEGAEPEVCVTASTYHTIEETVYTTAVQPPLPIRFEMAVEEKVVNLIEVTKLSVVNSETEIRLLSEQ